MTDAKKSQTVRNLWCTEIARPILAANEVVAAIRAAIAANNLTAQFTAGELTAMQAVETALASLAALPGVTAAESRYVPSHRSQALTITGVDDNG